MNGKMVNMTGDRSMVPAILFLAGTLLLIGPSLAETPVQSAGRYQIEPDGNGFVRLDTETGTLTYCEKSEDVWRCEVIVEGRTGADQRLQTLEKELAALKAELAALDERLAAIDSDDGAPPAAASKERQLSAEEQEKEFEEALSFAERMMRRFFDMIRELKNEVPPQQI